MSKLVNNEKELLNVLNDDSVKYFDMMLYIENEGNNPNNKSKYLVEKIKVHKYKIALKLRNYDKIYVEFIMGYFVKGENKIFTEPYYKKTIDDNDYKNVIINLPNNYFDELTKDCIERYVDIFRDKYKDTLENVYYEKEFGNFMDYVFLAEIIKDIGDFSKNIEDYKIDYTKYLQHELDFYNTDKSKEVYFGDKDDDIFASYFYRGGYTNRIAQQMLLSKDIYKLTIDSVSLFNSLIKMARSSKDGTNKINTVIKLLRENKEVEYNDYKEIFKDEYAKISKYKSLK